MPSPKSLQEGFRRVDLIEIGKSGTEIDYWKEYVDRDRPLDMRETILMQNYNLALKIFHSFKGETFACLKGNETDAMHEAVIGLIKAIERYNPYTGNKFSTFAYPYIKGAILQYIRDKHHPIRFSQVKSERVIRYWKIMVELRGIKTPIEKLDLDYNPQRLESLFNEAKAKLSNERDKSLTFDRWLEDVILYINCRKVRGEQYNPDTERTHSAERNWMHRLTKDYPTFEGDRFLVPPKEIDPRVHRVMERLEKVTG